MVWNTITTMKVNIISKQDFKCAICKEVFERDKQGISDLQNKTTFINHEICCSCQEMIYTNTVFSELKRLLSYIIEKPSTSYYISTIQEYLEVYLNIKNYFKI